MVMRDDCLKLLRDWCDGLLKHQVNGTGIHALDGGLYCEACAGVHGRSPDAVYPLMYMADATGEERYVKAAIALQAWGDTLACEDGSVYNDHNNSWNGITVFAAIALYHALVLHGSLLDDKTRRAWDKRLRGMSDWLYNTITSGFVTNINYLATNAAAMALLGRHYGRPEFLDRARELYTACARYIGTDGLLVGEGKPIGHVTPRGCRAVDIGYNVEESLPMLALYAHVMGDAAALDTMRASIHSHLQFMLPDGAWDNSFGTRNFKWTYWGGRTSDGFQEAAAAMPDDPVIVKAAWMNARLYRRSTHNGLLYGGPHLFEHGEKPCLHHTICHAKALASLLDSGAPEPSKDVCLPDAPALKYYREVDTYKACAGGLRATVTGYDFNYMSGGHASGGTLTLLWHEKTGPLIAASMNAYSMPEPSNMQLTLKNVSHRPLTPGVVSDIDGTRYAQYNDQRSHIEAREADGGVVFAVNAALADCNAAHEPRGARCELEYCLSGNSLRIKGRVHGINHARFVLPLIGKTAGGFTPTDGYGFTYTLEGGTVTLRSSTRLMTPEAIFFLPGGFEAWEAIIMPDELGRFEAELIIG